MDLRLNLFMKLIKKSRKLATLMSLPALDGNITLLTESGLLTLKSAPLFAFSLIAGPVAILVATTIGGTMKERMIIGLMAGITATSFIVVAAVLGPKLAEIVNFNVLKIFGGSAIILIGLTLFGLKIPDKIPMFIIITGFVISSMLGER